jgi:hypothetical protein
MAHSDPPSRGTLESQTAARHVEAGRIDAHPWDFARPEDNPMERTAADLRRDVKAIRAKLITCRDPAEREELREKAAMLHEFEEICYGWGRARRPAPRIRRAAPQTRALRRSAASSGRPAARRSGARATRGDPDDPDSSGDSEPPPSPGPARARRAGFNVAGVHGRLASRRLEVRA